MTNFKTPITALFALAASVAVPSYANDLANARCRTVNWTPGDIVTVQAQMYKQTHISLPEQGLDVVWGTKDLWDQDMVRTHVFMKPTSAQPEGAETTVTVVGASGNSYEFRVVRVAKLQSHCVTVKANIGMVNRAAWSNADKDTGLETQVQTLQQQLARANSDKTAIAAEAQRQTAVAVKSYRSALFSKYDWTEGSGWFAKSGVETVQDDGRFTYIRLKSDSRGIMSILADIDGEQEILEKVYDAAKREYRVAGVYPKFTLRAGESEMTITRGQ